jgi:DNA ligase D-like protein (predicted 3'-phosphoesterase)
MPSKLSAYQKKRRFTKTPEPIAATPPTTARRRKKLIFVIHKHHASHLHWDLRLEMNGVLKSWAVPKIPPTAKGKKRLAIKVENHPLEYSKFHGTIPEGNYGAGKVEIWDRGTYNLESKKKDKIVFELHGKKLKGTYCLIRTSYGNKPEKSWLFFKV